MVIAKLTLESTMQSLFIEKKKISLDTEQNMEMERPSVKYH